MKKFNFLKKSANTPPCGFRGASRVLGLVLVLLTLGVGQAWGTEYTYKAFTTSFVKGTTNGASGIGTSFSTSSSLSTISSSNEIFTSNPTSVSNCFYNTSGAGIRISKNGGGGSVKFTLTDALKDSTIYAIVVYASKVSGNTAAKLDITPTGGYTTTTNISNGGLTAYNTSTPATTSLTTYKLDTIKVGGKKINTLQFASANKGYTMLHAITIVTQTEKAATPSCSSEITITKGSNPANGTFTIDNSGTVCIDEGNASTTVTATPSSHYHLATVTSSGGGTIGSISNNTCTVSSISANTTINVTFAADPTYTVTWVAGSNPSFSTQTNYAGTALTDPGEPSPASYCPGGKVFVGWTATPIVGEGAEPADLFTSVSGMSIPVGGTTYYAVFATQGGSGSVTKSDELTYTSFFAACTPSGSNTSGSYTNFSDKSGSKSDAVYAGNLYKHGNGSSNCHDYIQMRTSSNSGIITTTSGGKAKKVTVEWNSGTANAKVVNIYGKNTAYSAISDLFSDATDGDLLGTITKGTSTELTITGDYEYIGIRSSDGAIYFDAISIDWQAGGGYTYTDFATTCCIPLGTINGSFNSTTQKVTWSAVADASGYKVKVENASHQTITDWTINNTTEYSTADLTCGGNTFYVYVKAYNNDNAGHCTGDGPESEAIEVTSAACTEPEIIVDPTSLTGLNYIVGVGPSAAQSFDVLGANLTGDLTVKANDNYEICLTNSATAADWKSGNTTLTIAKATAENGQKVYVRLKSGKTVGDYNSNTIKVYGGGVLEANAATVTVSGSVLKPTISVDPTSITGWNAQTGNAPSPTTKTIAVTGTNLKANITATLTAGSDYFTITPYDLTQSAGAVNGSVVIGVTEAAYASAATREGTLQLSTTDGDNKEVSISLTVADDSREKFTLLTSSNLNQLSDGAKLVLVYDDGLEHYYAMKNVTGTKGFDAVEDSETEFSIDGNQLVLEENNNVQVLTLGESGNYYSLSTGSAYLQNSGDKALTTTTESPLPSAAKWSIGVDNDGNVDIHSQSTNSQYIRYNSNQGVAAQPFRCYGSGAQQAIYAYFQPSTTPSISVTPSSLTGFTYVKGSGPSEAQNFSVSGMNLTGDLTVKAPTNYQVSVDGGESWSDAGGSKTISALGTLTSTTVKVRLAADLDINTYDDATGVKVYGGGILEANAKTISLSGSVTNPSHTITVSAGENGTVSPSGAQTVEEGHTLQVTATPAAGYQLDKWTISGGATTTDELTANTLTLTMGTEDATATASFIQKMVTNIAISGDETIKPSQEKTYTATVTPNDALVTAVTWSVIAGTGTATINASTGELTGGTPGTVTVRATATDGSNVYGEKNVSVQEVTYYTYARLTSSDDVTTGEYLITYDGGGNNPTSAYVLKGSNIGCENYLSNVPISKVGDDYIITLEDNTDAFNINATEKTVVGIGSNKYMYTTTTGNNSVVSSTDKKTFTALAYNNLQYSSNLYYLRWNNNGFRYYNQNTGVNAAIRLYRRMQLYNVTCNAATNGSVSANMSSAASGTTVTLTLSPETNYELDELTVTNVSTTETIETSGSGNSYTFTMPAANVSVSATFKAKIAHSITFANGGATAGSAPETMEDQYSETVITLPANTYVWPEHRFTGWQVTYGETVLDKAVGETFPMPDANVTITAQWEEIQYCALTLSINGVAQTPFNVVQLEEYDLTTHNPGTINGYSFVGWAESAEAEDVENDIHTIGTSYTPALNVAEKTLYAVFSRQDNTNVGKYKRVKADLGTAWAGDYLIAYSATVFADGQKAGTDGIGKGNTKVNPEDKLDGDFVDGSWGDTYKVTLEEISTNSNTYLLKTQDGKYNYQTSNSNGLANTSTRSTADDYPITVTFTDENDIKLGLGGSAAGAVFRYNNGSTSYFRYYASAGQQPVYLYKKQTAPTIVYTTRPETSYSVSYDLGGGAWSGVSHNAVQVKNGMEFTITEEVPVLDHNKFTKWQVGGADVSGTITISGTTVITANWVAKVESTLTYDKGTATGTNIVTNDVEESTNITLPAIGNGSGQANFTKDGYDFVGWLYEGTLYKSGETFVMPAVDATLVAQWKLQNTEKFALITDASLLIDGMKVVLAFNDDADGTQKDNIAGEMHSNGYLQIVAATFANNEVTVGEGAVVYTLETATNGWKLRKDANSYLTSSGADLKWDNAANATIWTISFDDLDVIIANGSNIIRFNYSSPRFKTYTSTQRAIQLYASQTIIANNATISEIGYVQGDVIIVNENKTLTIDEPITPEAIIVKDGATVTASSAINANSVIVENGGELITTSTLTVNDLTIESASGAYEVAGTSGEVTGSGAVTVSGDIYLEIKLCEYDENIEEENKIVNANGFLTQKGSQNWYCISAPFEVAINDGFFWGDGTQMELNTHFQLFEWDGARRATGSSGWRRTSGNMKAGIAYFIGFDDERVGTTAGMNQNVIKLKAMSKNISTEGTIDVKEYTTNSAGSNYENWNGLGNPRLHHIALDQSVQAFNYNKQTYSSYPSGEYNFVVGTPFFIQSTTDLTIETANNAEFRAPKREVEEDYMFRVRIGKSGEAIADNHVYVRASDNAISSFEEGHDMPTMNGTTASSALIWTENYGMRLAIEEAPLVNNTASYALGIFAPNAGNYTISVPTERENADLYLTYEGAIIWNLSMGAYTMDLNKGITNGYGLLLQAKAPNAATGVDEVTGDGLQVTGAQKVIIDEHVYILRGGQMYDVNGKMVK